MTDVEYENCWDILQKYTPQSISWNHYDLAAETELDDVSLWREFLLKREVIDWLEEERMLLQTSELAKLTANVSNSRSYGQAQLISAMKKLEDSNKTDASTGPAFIYCYVPLTTEQREAENVQELTEDIFYVKPDTRLQKPAPKPEPKPESEPEEPPKMFDFQ